MALNPAQLPFKEAIDFFKAKIKLPTADWTSIWEQQHSHAFVVAGAQSDALLEDLYNAIQDAKQKGGGYADFKTRFQDITTKHGWSYNGSPGWRSRIIYDTNITQSYNAGRYVQMQAVKHLRPFWQYRHTSIEHPRLNHKAWDNLILPADDAWWNTHMPQNGWGCKCRVDSLSRFEAKQQWEAQGKTGADIAPEIVWEDRIVGKKGSNPRTVSTPQGVDPGFGYNVGKAYKEGLTVPPVDGYSEILKDGKIKFPSGSELPLDLSLPKHTYLEASAKIPKDTEPKLAIGDYLSVFNADIENGAVYTDKTGTSLAISKALFIKGADKNSDNFKWLSDPEKTDRIEYINLLAMTLIEPDEIWWHWEKDTKSKDGKWRLKRRYLRIFEIDGEKQYAYTIFEWNKQGWQGATTFLSLDADEEKRIAYFNSQRRGRLVYKK